jgi:hypothetical protein
MGEGKMTEIQSRTKYLFYVSLLMSANVSSSSLEKEVHISNQTRSQITENVSLGSDWKLQSIVEFSSKKPKMVEKSIVVKDELTGKNIELDIQLDSETKKLVSPFGVHVTYCYREESTCLTWVIIKTESEGWHIDHTFENY